MKSVITVVGTIALHFPVSPANGKANCIIIIDSIRCPKSGSSVTRGHYYCCPFSLERVRYQKLRECVSFQISCTLFSMSVILALAGKTVHKTPRLFQKRSSFCVREAVQSVAYTYL